MLEYELIRSRRKTLAIYIKQDGSVVVRAPLKTGKAYIDDFIEKKQDWISTTQSRLSVRQEDKRVIELSSKEVSQYKKQAKQYFQERCQYYSGQMGLQCRTVKINTAKTRWGSCNGKGDINFTYRLLFAPQELIDYVVVHELAHLKEMNHSPRFWAVVEQTMPDYKTRKKKLREYQHKVELIIN